MGKSLRVVAHHDKLAARLCVHVLFVAKADARKLFLVWFVYLPGYRFVVSYNSITFQ